MAGTEDQSVNLLPSKTAPTAGDKIMMIGTAEEYQIDYQQLARAFLAELQNMEFSQLQTVAKNLFAAVNELNSKTNNLRFETIWYPDYTYENLNQALRTTIDEKIATKYPNSIVMIDFRHNSSFVVIAQVYDDNYASYICFGYGILSLRYGAKASGKWNQTE